ncbi:MAG: CPBP family intramembrane metalloprotease [Sphingomonas taxi]
MPTETRTLRVMPIAISAKPIPGSDKVTLVILLLVSLFLTTTVNRWAGVALVSVHSDAGWIASAAIPSCIVILSLYFCSASRSGLRWPRLNPPDRRFVISLSALWLGLWLSASVAVAFAMGYWPTYARGWPAILAFLAFGPIGEELWFRGLIFERARRLWANSARPAIWISTVAFSLHHVQLHRLPLDGAALAQIGFTLPMGLVFAQLRERSGSLLPALLLHVATNLPFIF